MAEDSRASCRFCGSDLPSRVALCPYCQGVEPCSNPMTITAPSGATTSGAIVIGTVLAVVAATAFAVARGAAWLFHLGWPNWYIGLLEKLAALDLLVLWMYFAFSCYKAFSNGRLPFWKAGDIEDAATALAAFYLKQTSELAAFTYLDRRGETWRGQSYMPSRLIIRRVGGWRRVAVVAAIAILGSYILPPMLAGMLNQ